MKSLFFLSLTVFLACSTDDDGLSLPLATQTGQNTFGCYINGNLLVPRDGSGTFNSPDYGLSLTRGPGPEGNIRYYELEVRDYRSGTGGLLTIHIENITELGEGTYTINQSNCEDNVDSPQNINLYCRWWDEQNQIFKWYCSVENGGSLTVSRLDMENAITSGTFSCTVANRDNPNDIIEITEGRFDINSFTLRDKIFQ